MKRTTRRLSLAIAKVSIVPAKRITGCARCGGAHVGVVFKLFTRPCGNLTHYAPCPTNHEPILMRLEPDEPLAARKKDKSQLGKLLALSRAERRAFNKLSAAKKRRVARRDLKKRGLIP